MRIRLTVLVAAAVALLAVAAAAAAPPPLAEGVVFKPVAKSGVTGTGTVTQNGIGTGVVVRLRGLEPGSTARVLLRTGRYPKLSASFAKAVTVKADASQRAQPEPRARIGRRDAPGCPSACRDIGSVVRRLLGIERSPY